MNRSLKTQSKKVKKNKKCMYILKLEEVLIHFCGIKVNKTQYIMFINYLKNSCSSPINMYI